MFSHNVRCHVHFCLQTLLDLVKDSHEQRTRHHEIAEQMWGQYQEYSEVNDNLEIRINIYI